MNDRIMQFRVGVLVLVTPVITAILVLLLGGFPSLVTGTYPIYINFQTAPGVSVNTPVRQSGLLIGRVTDIGFAEDRSVLVTCAIESNRELRRNDRPRIKSTLLGDAVIEFFMVDQPELAEQVIKPGDVLVGDVTADPLQVIGNLEKDLSVALTSIGRTSEDIGSLVRDLNALLGENDDQFARVVTKAELALEDIQRAAAGANQFLGDQRVQEDLRIALSELPEAMRDFRRTISSMDGTIASADRNLQNLEGLTRPLGERGEVMVAQLDRSTVRLETLLEELTIFVRALNNPNGSVGQLVNNPDLYQNLNSAAANIEQLTRELRPIVYDVRVFTDKIARDPGRLGVRGAIQQNVPIK